MQTDSIPHRMYIELEMDNMESFILTTMKEFNTYLKQLSINLCFTFREVPVELQNNIVEILKSDRDIQLIMGNLEDLFFTKSDNYIPGLLVRCPYNHHLARSSRLKNPDHKWGTCYDSRLSLVYPPIDQQKNRHLIWHEAFHLLGAEDCYKHQCEKPNSIMQYAPTEENVGNWPFLCQRNIEKIQRLA